MENHIHLIAYSLKPAREPLGDRAVTGEDVVYRPIREYIQRRKQMEILNLFGKIDYDPDYEYKKQRWRP